jgi:hypothetical protein
MSYLCFEDSNNYSHFKNRVKRHFVIYWKSIHILIVQIHFFGKVKMDFFDRWAKLGCFIFT